jgi:phosphohistidine phosphatase
MELILWRHAEAEDPGGKDDAARELTKRGRKQAERMAHWLKPLVDDSWRIVSSPTKRTLQTVRTLERPFEESEAVGLDATPATVLGEAGWPDAKGAVLVVGHQPTLGQVAASLVGGMSGDLSIRKGAIWWFTTRSRGEARETVLKAVLDPDLLDD